MSTTDTAPSTTGAAPSPLAVPRGKHSSTAVVAVSLVVGMATAVALTMLVFPGATEGVTAGATLVAFGLGWATLYVLTARSPRPQRWAAVPAVAMALTGNSLVASAPSDHSLGVLAWAWPPLALALAAWTWTRMRRHMAGGGRWLLSVTLLVFGAAAVGAGVRQGSTEPFADAHPVPGATFSVNGHALHIDCRGHGSPTVVLFNGLGEFSASWARIVDGTTPTTRVCAYDRAGQGWSDDLPSPQDATTATADLHALLDAAGESGPFVLVGHSIGGPYAMTYADQHPDDVAGMVLLDSTSPHQFTTIPSYPRDYLRMRRTYGVVPGLARLGLGRLLASSHLSAADADLVNDWSASPRAGRNARDEVMMLPTTLRRARGLTTLGHLPLAVLTSCRTALGTVGWTTAQRELATLSTDAVHDVVLASHSGMVEDPEGAAASIHAITSVVSAARRHTRLATP